MLIAEAEIQARKQLNIIYDQRESSAITDMLLEHITTLSRVDRIARKQDLLMKNQIEQFDLYLKRLMQHEPIQYVLNKAWFYGLELFVDNNVLIPRPETEQLVQWILDTTPSLRKNLPDHGAPPHEWQALKIMDIGTGSGCIALALKKHIPQAEVWACDNSDKALTVARRNGSQLDIRVDFQGLDFLDLNQQKQLPMVHVAVSNPPYIPVQNKKEMMKNVVDYEPHAALFVPDDDALVFYRYLAAFGKQSLHKEGKLFMELHEGMGQDVAALFEKEGYSKIELKEDFQGKERMMCASI